jgi:hypothetical protein
LERHGLKAREGGAEAEVDLLAQLHRGRRGVVRRAEVRADGAPHLVVRQRGEARALDGQAPVGLAAHVDHLGVCAARAREMTRQ